MKVNSYDLTEEEKRLLKSGKEMLAIEKAEKMGTKGDRYNKETLIKIIERGTWDGNPRPKYHDVYYDAQDYDKTNRVLTTKDGEKITLEDNQEIHEYDDRKEIWTPAHTLWIPPEVYKYNDDVDKNESPLLTVRNIACKDAISELFWIWVKGSNDLVEFDELLGLRPKYTDPITGVTGKQEKVNKDLPGCRTWMSDEEVSEYIATHDLTKEELEKIKTEASFVHNWWIDWALKNQDGSYILNEKGHPNIGKCYGYSNNAYHQIETLRNGIKKDPDGRRHILCLWQLEDFKKPHGLKPCAFLTMWNVRHGRDGKDYLDCSLVQRSSDYMTAGSINQYQYMVLQAIFAADLGYEVGQFTWFNNNVQIYDRHIPQALEQINRETINCTVETIVHNEDKTFEELLPSDIEIKGYPRKLINEKNPQQKFQLGI